MRLYGALYGSEKEASQMEMELEKRGDARKAATSFSGDALKERSEDVEQIIAVAELKRRSIPLHHSPNGGRRDIAEAAKFKRMGVSPGFPDLFIPRARKGYHGLYIELKKVGGGNGLSKAQEVWRDLLIAEGYAWYQANGAAECIKIVLEYLG